MRMRAFASRTWKEILRDPLNIAFGLGFPLVLLLLMSAIQANIPVPLFEISRLAPGVMVFGLSFLSLFTGNLIAKDRSSSFLTRLFASPLTARDFILGYTLPVLPMAIMQGAVCLAASLFWGFPVSVNMLLLLAVNIPAAVFFIGIGLLAGSVFTDKQVGPVCGALLTNVSAWLSGIWFELDIIGGTFKKVADALPFVHAFEAARAAADGELEKILPHLAWVGAYALVVIALAVFAFQRKMKG